MPCSSIELLQCRTTSLFRRTPQSSKRHDKSQRAPAATPPPSSPPPLCRFGAAPGAPKAALRGRAPAGGHWKMVTSGEAGDSEIDHSSGPPSSTPPQPATTISEQSRVPSAMMSDQIRWASSCRRLCEDDDPGESCSGDFEERRRQNPGGAPQRILGVASGGRRRISGRPAARNGEYRNSAGGGRRQSTEENFSADRAVRLGMLGRMEKILNHPLLRIFNYIF
jgi:hypothetical protein